MRHYEPMPADVEQAFCDYVELTDRSLARLADEYRSRGDFDTPPPTRRLRTLAEWSTRYGWVARLELLRNDEIMAGRLHAEERIAGYAGKAIDTLDRMLDATKVISLGGSGKTIEVPDTDIQMRAALAILDRLLGPVALKVRHEVSGPGGGPIPSIAVRMDLEGKDAGELVEMLRAQIAGHRQLTADNAAMAKIRRK